MGMPSTSALTGISAIKATLFSLTTSIATGEEEQEEEETEEEDEEFTGDKDK